ncbi:hypothetical protein TNCV_303851 [Trichonephila clavipes]|nr:hypothetical protein TNCV_303851 [Trichonephila clavipes]
MGRPSCQNERPHHQKRLQCTRRKDRPNLIWIDGLEKDLLILRIKIWRTVAGKRLAWESGRHGVTPSRITSSLTTRNAREGWPHTAALQETSGFSPPHRSSISSQKILQGAIDRGITDPTNPMIQMESTSLELNNSRLQSAVSEYTSLPPCGIPNCSRHNSKDTPLKLNSPDPSPPPTPIPTKRKENPEGFTSPPSRKLTKPTLSNSNTDLNFKINLTNTFSALDNTATEAPIETPVTSHKSLENTPRKTNQSIQSPKLPPPIMLLITDDLRSHTKTLVGKMPALRIKAAGKYVKLYTDTQPQHDTLKQLLEVLKYPFYTFTPKHERPIKVVLKGLPRSTTTAEIKSDLFDLGYTINKVTQLTGNITKQLYNITTKKHF